MLPAAGIGCLHMSAGESISYLVLNRQLAKRLSEARVLRIQSSIFFAVGVLPASALPVEGHALQQRGEPQIRPAVLAPLQHLE